MKLWIPLLATSLLMLGCTAQKAPVVKAPPAKKVVKKKPKRTYVAPKPKKKNIKLKEVEDTNFSSEYMYPETKKKKEKTIEVAKAPSSSMTKAECISMIGQGKFDKYTQMLGGEAAAIKKCQMIKAM
jgi:PBP1b-binding outer membrane lipoprotein LpoB